MRKAASASNGSAIGVITSFSCVCKLVSARRDASDVFCKALMASETVGSKRQMASSDAAVFCNGLGRKHRRRQSSGLLG